MWPGPGDHPVLAAALKTQAQTIVTENLRDFPAAALDTGRAVRQPFQRPAITAERMLLDLEARGVVATPAPHIGSL